MKVNLTKKDISLINSVFTVSEYLAWHNDVGNNKAQEIINEWNNFKKFPDHQGIFADTIELQKKLSIHCRSR